MHGWLEQVGQRGDSEQEERAAEKLMDLAREAEDAIETFVINSEKRRRWGVLHWTCWCCLE
ncbi:LRR and NB-ARC domain disease resistance protein, partial [Trifolium medium]|nr:LRR and NB-ARC domain disease resistance protein [Trifolium medium]